MLAGTERFDCDGVVLSTPAPVTSALLRPHDDEAAALLDAIDYASVVLVTFQVGVDEVPPRTGTGFLVPRAGRRPKSSEPWSVTACTFLDQKWPHLAREDDALLRASMGRAHDERASQWSDAEVTERAWEELGLLMGVNGAPKPKDAAVVRHPASFPQYRVHHLLRTAAVEAPWPAWEGWRSRAPPTAVWASRLASPAAGPRRVRCGDRRLFAGVSPGRAAASSPSVSKPPLHLSAAYTHTYTHTERRERLVRAIPSAKSARIQAPHQGRFDPVLPRRRGSVAVPSLGAGILLALSLPPWGWWPLGIAGAGLFYWRLAGLPLRARLWAGWLAGLGCYAIGLFWAQTFNWYGALVLILVEALFFALAAGLTPPDRGRALAFVGACTVAEAVRMTWPFGGLPLGGVFLGQARAPLLELARLGGPLLITAGVWAGGRGGDLARLMGVGTPSKPRQTRVDRRGRDAGRARGAHRRGRRRRRRRPPDPHLASRSGAGRRPARREQGGGVADDRSTGPNSPR